MILCWTGSMPTGQKEMLVLRFVCRSLNFMAVLSALWWVGGLGVGGVWDWWVGVVEVGGVLRREGGGGGLCALHPTVYFLSCCLCVFDASVTSGLLGHIVSSPPPPPSPLLLFLPQHMTASSAKWLRCPSRERQTRGLILACSVEIFRVESYM